MDKSYVSKEFLSTTSDIIYKLKFNGSDVYFYVLMEMQSKPDNTMPFRLLQYMTALLTDIFENDKKIRNKRSYKLPAVIPILLYNGIQKWNIPLEYRDYTKDGEIFGDNIINFKYLLFDLNRTEEKLFKESAKALIDYIFAFDYNRKDVGVDDADEIIKLIPKIAKELTTDDLTKLVAWLRYNLYDGKLPPKTEEKLLEELKGEGNMTHALERSLQKRDKMLKQEGRLEERQENILTLIESAKKMIKKGLGFDDVKEFTQLPDDKLMPLFSQRK